MFPGMFQARPSKKEAMKHLQFHAAIFGTWVAVIRVTPYILNYLQKEELQLDL